MGDTLAGALAAANERQGGGGGKSAPEPASPGKATGGGGGGGLRGLCRTLFRHCVEAVGYISPGESAEEADVVGASAVRGRGGYAVRVLGFCLVCRKKTVVANACRITS